MLQVMGSTEKITKWSVTAASVAKTQQKITEK